MHLVSIIMPTYNSEKTILDSITSVLNQSYSNWELLVVDDCSSDSTTTIVESLLDERIKLFILDKNSGSPATPRNTALKHASGYYIAFLDSDDLWLNTKLQLQIAFMEENFFDFTCTAYNILESDGKCSTYIPPSFATYKDLLLNNSIGCLTAIVTKDLIDDLQFPMLGHEDYALWLKLLKKTHAVYALTTPLAVYNKVDGSVSSNKLKLLSFFWRVYRVSEGFSMKKSLYYCFRYFINVVWFKYK